jgi:hypothetical protein
MMRHVFSDVPFFFSKAPNTSRPPQRGIVGLVTRPFLYKTCLSNHIRAAAKMRFSSAGRAGHDRKITLTRNSQ